MTSLLQLYPGDHYVAWAVSVLLQATAVLLIAWALAGLLARRNPAAQYATWLVALALLFLSPLTGYLAVSSGLSLVELPLPQETSEGPTAERLVSATPWPQDSPTLPSSSSSMLPSYPPMTGDGLDPAQGFPSVEPEIEPSPAPASALDGVATAASSSPWSPADWFHLAVVVVSIVWAGGIAYLSLRLVRRARKLSLLLHSTRHMDVPGIELLLQDICQGMSLKRTPELRVWETPGTCLAPVTVGALRPVIVLSPAMFHGLAPNRLREALVHECAHVLRRDPLIGLLQRIAVIGFWPHPLVWVLDRALARAREEVCDNYVLRNSDSTSYAETLFEVSQRAQSQGRRIKVWT